MVQVVGPLRCLSDACGVWTESLEAGRLLHRTAIEGIMLRMENPGGDPLRVAARQRKASVPVALLALALALRWCAVSASAALPAVSRSYLPLVSAGLGGSIPDESYTVVAMVGSQPSLPPEAHPDLNLAVRGYAPTSAELALVDYGGDADPRAPQLAGLLLGRLVTFGATYQVFDWNWEAMDRGPTISDPPVTALGFDVRRGETLHVPASGYTIGEGWEVLVLYASSERITLKYTREDSVVQGYTLHVENVCVEPRLLCLYETCEARGRDCLPALYQGQAFGRAGARQVVVAIRDHGCFLDPRSRKDWWQGY